MSRLRSALKSKFAERKDDIQIYTPRNVEVVKLKFRGERMAKVRVYGIGHQTTILTLLLSRPWDRWPSPPPLLILPFQAYSCQKILPTPFSVRPTCVTLLD